MLGAQALRTKQKAEQKEREKRQKERQRNLELQRERIHKAASEDAAAMQATTADANFYLNQGITKTKQRHSVHATAFNNHLLPHHSHELHHREKIEVPQRSPSTDCGKPGDPNHPQSQNGGGGSRFMKWLGLSSTPNTATNGTLLPKHQNNNSQMEKKNATPMSWQMSQAETPSI